MDELQPLQYNSYSKEYSQDSVKPVKIEGQTKADISLGSKIPQKRRMFLVKSVEKHSASTYLRCHHVSRRRDLQNVSTNFHLSQ